MKKRRENDGYCFVKQRIKPHEILDALENIPYELLPPTLKKVEDFIKELNITSSYTGIPGLRISRSLKESMKSMEKISKNADKDFIFTGTIPYIKPIDKCDYGQLSTDMAKNINIRELYRGIEDGLYEFSTLLHTIKPLINEKGKDLIDYKYIEYDEYNPDRIRREDNDFTKLGSAVYNKQHTDFDTAAVLKAKKELKETNELRKAFDFKSEEYKELSDKVSKLADKRNRLQEEAKEDFKKAVHNYWLEDWYDKYAWDFDEEERKELKNPYLKKEK